MRHTLKYALSLALAVVLTLGMATPAAAATRTFRDSLGDVKSPSSSGGVITVQTLEGSTDIESMRVKYGKKKLKITVTFTQGDSGNWNHARVAIAPKANPDKHFYIWWRTFRYKNVDPDDIQPNGLYRSDQWPVTKPIAAVTMKKKPRKVTFTVPTKKIGSPKAVRLAVDMQFISLDGGESRLDYLPNPVITKTASGTTASFPLTKKAVALG